MFRRKHKLLLLTSLICAIVLLIVTITQYSAILDYTTEDSNLRNLIHDYNPTSNSITTPDQHDKTSIFGSIFNSIFSILGETKEKTVPFAETGAALQSEFNNIIKQTSEGQLQLQRKMSAEMKLKLIAESHKKFDPNLVNLKKGYKFYDKVFDILTSKGSGKPGIDSLGRYKSKHRIYHARYQYKPDDLENEKVFSEEYLSQFLELNSNELKIMKRAHKYVVDNLNQFDSPEGLYKGNGIVFVGGGKFNWLTLLSIKSIRAIGSDLPIEVFIPKLDEYEPDLCVRVFPALGARCIYLPHVLSEGNSPSSKIQFKGYQYKALAIILSSFENVLLLDSDNIPVHPPDHLFTSEPFVSNGLIVWPDFWKRATSPDYYRIADITLDKTKLTPKYNELTGEYENVKPYPPGEEVPLHERLGAIPDPTSESGQLMVSKKSHMKAILLALYYNMYGPSHFYPLFSQGSDGEGDKETFLAATVALKQPFYQVSKFLNAFGYFNTKNEFVGTGMGQYDPAEDFEMNKKKSALKGKSNSEQAKLIEADPILSSGPKILFVHANFPKLNPWLLRQEEKIINEKGQRIRLYGTGMKKRTGYDFETVQWSNMKFLLCELQIDLKAYEDVDREELCMEIATHLSFLKSTINTLE
ncbi:alpha-1,2-mannosyltransferase Mnn2p [[Candida] railenensis]|uniref:Alpha-1,2-mannosyltransferase Mnn2p n=1 Tax=[Candida] railenensis TaxID=45579 RepID=A0A9P0QP42_9ASCO|nr:alpha-1,2-mannosyltransferase Mnn2p [[Candida] railenensis]